MNNLFKVLSILLISTCTFANDLDRTFVHTSYSKAFSQLDGSHIKMTEFLLKSMLNPDSFKHIKTTVTESGSIILIKCVYSSKLKNNEISNQSLTMAADFDGELLLKLKGSKTSDEG